MIQPKVTLVFPCWHASKHLPHVLEDLQAQTFKDFEAILVNDGDDSQMEAMEKIAACDNRIRIVSLIQNSGIAAARNAGTDAATSQWVTYPDPDDRLGPDYVKSLYEAVGGTDVEMACGGYTWFSVKTGQKSGNYIKIDSHTEIMDIASAYERMMPAFAQYNAWNKLYNVDVIRKNGLRQDANFKNGQDYAFNMSFFPFVKKVGVIKDCGYTYFYYDGDNNCKRYNPNFVRNVCETVGSREKFHRHIGWSEQRIKQLREEEFAHSSLKMIRNYFAIDSPLSIGEASSKIKSEILMNPEIVNSILHKDFGKDRVMWSLQQMVKSDNALMMALFFKTLVYSKRHFGLFYSRIKPIFRGE